ncbi:glycosyltransferase family 4 protein [Mucilaginibacter paludis]|uniref:Glycosyl transferase group 1 n=1 Tax=Mucilaginibacter paludis DSM 18603 TaxID=714943 RepID=H1YJ23_9SPHI|nr:glycosyltransferase family 4 protein [Mucilaginibacter paludis]EHQ27718.1 glycosyl transferase group 1 [Mucilaginibacter paludis DSM 18603]
MKRVIAVKISNKYGEDAEIFNQSLISLVKDGFHVDLITSEPSNTLRFSDKVKKHLVRNHQTNNGFLKVIYYLISQLQLFFMVLKMSKPGDTVYVSSTSPFIAALAAKINSAKVFYHIQNTPVHPDLKDKFLIYMTNITANHVIFTSASLKLRLNLTVKKQTVIYHTPSADFIRNRIAPETNYTNKPFAVVMITPLKAYKGIAEFVKLAKQLPDMLFELVITSDFDQVKNFEPLNTKLPNLYIFNKTANFQSFFDLASVVINLSDTDQYLESFDVNILRAMYYGKPVIVPEHGGLIELINPKKHGIAMDSKNLDVIAHALRVLSTDQLLYNQISTACLKHAALFTPDRFNKQISSLFNGHMQVVYSNLDQLFGNKFLSTASLN